MVCLACLLPLFLVPFLNLLPILFHFILGKIYRLLGKEYRKPERAPVACPMKPAAIQSDMKVVHDPGYVASAPAGKAVSETNPDDKKLD